MSRRLVQTMRWMTATAVVGSLSGCGGETSVTRHADTPAAAPAQQPPTVAAGTRATEPAATGAPQPGSAASNATVESAGSRPTDRPASSAPDALRFTAPLVGGGTFDAAALAGRPVLFWFWAPY